MPDELVRHAKGETIFEQVMTQVGLLLALTGTKNSLCDDVI